VLAHREDVAQRLRRVPLVGQAVPDRDAAEQRQRLDQLLLGAAVLDAVVHPAQHARGVLHRLLVADLRAARVQVGDVGALVVGGHLERAAGAGRRLLEDEREVLARQVLLLAAALLRRLELADSVSSSSHSWVVRSISLRKLRPRSAVVIVVSFLDVPCGWWWRP
jgi:hypothetical protein